MGFEQQLHFEAGSIRLDDGSLFSPLKEASDRWLVTEPAPYQVLGDTAHVLYQVPQRGYILVEYIDCREVHGPSGNIIVSDHAPRGRLINNRMAADFILHFQLELPEELHEIATQPPERPAPRPLETWADSDLVVQQCVTQSHEVDPIAQAEEIRGFAVLYVQSQQDPRNSYDREDERTRRFLEATLFRSYAVDLNHWIEQHQGIPPKWIDFLDLDWPEHSELIRDALMQLRSLLRIPFSVFAAGRSSINAALYPSMEERELATELLRKTLPEVEMATEKLIQALAKYKQALVESEQVVSEESENVFQINEKNEWTVRFEGVSANIPALLGMSYIHELLSRRDHLYEVMELEAVVKCRTQIEQGTTGENLDQQSRDEIQAEYDLLTEQLADAEHSGNSEDAATIQLKIQALADRLSEATGLGGRIREDGNMKERARQRVSKAITDSIKEIKKQHSALAAHLKKTIRRGLTLIYEPNESIDWET